MLTEQRCGRTHIQFFIDGICVGTVRMEYADKFRQILADAISDNTANNQELNAVPTMEK